MKIKLFLSSFLSATTLVMAGSEVMLIDGSWLPGEGRSVSTQSEPLHRPFGIDFDADGNLWIVELEGGRVHRLANGRRTRVAGDGSRGYRGDGGPAGMATFNGMHNVAVTPGGDVYISDSWNHCIRRIDRGSVITTIAGTGEPGFSGDGGPATSAKFDYVMCITLNHANDKLLVADLRNRRIREVNLESGRVRTVAGNGKKGVPKDGAKAIESPLVDPRAVCSDAKGNIYVLERGGHALRVVRPNGLVFTVAGDGQRGDTDGPAMKARFNSPKHICVGPDQNVIIADDGNALIKKYNPRSGQVTTLLGRGKIKLSKPHGVCWERGNLYVVDTGHNRILRLNE